MKSVYFNLETKKSILREKCTILEQQYKINRRLSPRKLISVGKSVEPPPMAPSETYVSTYESEISESQLKVKNLIKITFYDFEIQKYSLTLQV